MSDLSRLFRRIADEQDALRAHSGSRDAVRRHLAGLDLAGAARESRIRRVVVSLAAAAVALAIVLVFFPFRQAEVLGVRVGKSSAPPLIDAWLGAPDDEHLPLAFSDGTRMELAPKARARLRNVRREGARVELANGSLRVEVRPRAGTSFWVDAGPFSVHVTGTRFDVRFDPRDETFTLALEEGHVELSGCVFGEGRPLAAGQTVRASCKKRTLDVGYGNSLYRDTQNDRASEGPAAIGSSASPALAPKAPASASPEPLEREPGGAAQDRDGDAHTPRQDAPLRDGDGSDWLALARRGTYATAFERARIAGFEAECAKRSAAEVAVLADVARHAGAWSEARHALMVLRRRFPGTDEAALAAFTLGRLEFDGRRSFPGAIEWFRTYLRERPRGPMTREALGRLIEALRATGDLTAARDVAHRYAREYPSGPHAELATRVLALP